MIWLLKKIPVVSFLSSLLLLGGCLTSPRGVIISQEQHLLLFAFLLMLIVVIPVFTLVILVMVRFRASKANAKYSPDWKHSSILEAVCWGVPAALVLVLAIVTWRTSHTLDPYRPLAAEKTVKPLTIQVISLDWRWLFIYPDQGIATINEVVFPENVPVVFKLTSQGPMNAFMILGLGGQIYTMAGMQTEIHLMSDRPGTYYGLSYSYSGDGFANMHFTAKSTATRDQFDRWVNQVRADPLASALTEESYNALAQPSHDKSVHYFSTVSPHLFADEIRSRGFVQTIGKDL